MTGFAPLSVPVPVPLDAPERPVEAVKAPAAVTHVMLPGRTAAEAQEAIRGLPSPLSPGKRLALALKTLRWTYGTLAIELGLSPSTTRNWGLGRQPLPAAVLRWVELLAEFHRNVPPPR